MLLLFYDVLIFFSNLRFLMYIKPKHFALFFQFLDYIILVGVNQIPIDAITGQINFIRKTSPVIITKCLNECFFIKIL